ncbi:MAG: hypothetical protein VCB06_05485 [Alphaproteobacteria bacterium]
MIFVCCVPAGKCVFPLVAIEELPDGLKNEIGMVSICIGGSVHVKVLIAGLIVAGFDTPEACVSEQSKGFIADWARGAASKPISLSPPSVRSNAEGKRSSVLLARSL